MKYLNLKERKGYTLLELIISISIFAIISVVVINNFRQGEKMDDLRTGSIELVNNFREAQNLGMSGQIVNICNGGDNNLNPCNNDTDCTGEGSCGLVPVGGYGISIDKVVDDSFVRCNDEASTKDCPTSYKLFADIGGTIGKFDDGTDIVLEGKNNYPLPNNVRIIDFYIECSWLGAPGPQVCPNVDFTGIDISFRPPKPTPFFFNRSEVSPAIYSEQSIEILIEHSDTGKCRTISLNGVSGQVDEVSDANCITP